MTPDSRLSANATVEHAGLSLEQWIITQRLEGARADLTSPTSRHRTIAAIAHSWGFSNHSHFATRFRAAYGISPRDYQHHP